MHNFLQKKWIGFWTVVVFTFAMSIFFTTIISPKVKQLYPVIREELEQFLPITIKDGTIIDPQNKLVKKIYTNDDKKFNVVLDTRSDELNPSDLKEEGIYVSRKCVYVVDQDNQPAHENCFTQTNDNQTITITPEQIRKWTDGLGSWITILIAGLSFLILFLFFYAAILLYTVVMHWLLAIVFKVPFSQTLFINSLAYVFFSILEIALSVHSAVLVRLGLMLLINVLVCQIITKKESI